MTAIPVPPVDQVQIIDHDYRIGPSKISGRFLIWSPLTTSYKTNLNFDNPPDYTPARGQFTWKRATLISALKSTLLNDCLSDAIIYAGYRGSKFKRPCKTPFARHSMVRHPTTAVIFRQFTGTAPEELSSSRRVLVAAWCSTRSRHSRSRRKRKARIRSPHSTKPYRQSPKSTCSPTNYRSSRWPDQRRHSPIAELDVTASRTPSMATALGVLSHARGRYHAKHLTDIRQLTTEAPLSLVAFTDPNDLLSYRLPPNGTAIVGNGTSVVNVITSNAAAYFGYAENPYPAHTGYNQNPDALRVLFGGSSRSGPR